MQLSRRNVNLTITQSCCHEANEEFEKLTNREHATAEEQTHVTSNLTCQKQQKQIFEYLYCGASNVILFSRGRISGLSKQALHNYFS